jgi:uncharacterized membrane protein YdbT with pleckstrin-like domain
MFNAVRDPLLWLMRVPPEPEPPQGSPESVKVFRAGRNFFTWSVLKWSFIQLFAGVGAIVLVVTLTVASRAPSIPYVLRYIFGAFAGLWFLAYLTQLLISFFLLRLNYEMRWYIVTDRSLRIRYGIWRLEEMTMTFANIQQINIVQGPLQRLLGIANLEVTSAGGGGAKGPHGQSLGRQSHVGYFEGVDNAQEIRDLILERLKRYRDSGLGDPDDHQAHGLEEAAREVLGEARELRRVVAARA